jgi:hypothetical protein
MISLRLLKENWRFCFQLLVLVLGILESSEAYAQNIVLRSGLNVSSIVLEGDNSAMTHYSMLRRQGVYFVDSKNIKGLNFGVYSQIPINKNLYLEGGLAFSSKGGSFTTTESLSTMANSNVEIAQSLYCVDLQCTLGAKIEMGKSKFYCSFGPYLGNIIGGKRLEYYTNDKSDEVSYTNGFGLGNQLPLNLLDFGLNAGLGVEIKSIQFSITYGLGLKDIYDADTNRGVFAAETVSVKNRVLGFSVGYPIIRKIGGSRKPYAPTIKKNLHKY